jgi:hypothetical protein
MSAKMAKMRTFGIFRSIAGRRKKEMTLQEHFFRLALEERGIKAGPVEIDHQSGRCWSEITGWRPVTFPQSLIELVAKIRKSKTSEYFFRGVITPERQWLAQYPNVNSSSYGRDPARKYTPDLEYYSQLSVAKFGLAPIGDCPWSYRFFEAIMCYAIPIIGTDDEDIFANGFAHARHGSPHSYDEKTCKDNYEILINKHTLSGLHFDHLESRGR